eukprot:9243642-Pyramimonas_sp.AAC.1
MFVVLPCRPRPQTDGVARPRPITNAEAKYRRASKDKAAKPAPNTGALGHRSKPAAAPNPSETHPEDQ